MNTGDVYELKSNGRLLFISRLLEGFGVEIRFFDKPDDPVIFDALELRWSAKKIKINLTTQNNHAINLEQPQTSETK
jgi:hypothetical protein